MNTRNKMDPFRIAVLDLYQGEANQGMRGIQSIIESWSEQKGVRTQVDYFDVRIKKQIPDLSYDAYISSGGPGSPLDSRYEDWDVAWCQWLDQLNRWNQHASQGQEKHIFFICFSFQLACRFF
jgi:homoserine O-succinyltransferase